MSGQSGPVLVTGATGFVGAAVARRLLAVGREVRVLTRAGSDRRNLEGLAVETCIGDLTEPASLGAAVRGCDQVYHVAADYRLWVRDPETLYRANVEGSRAIVRAAAEAGARRIVYTSSVAVLGIPKGGVGDEETPVTLADMIGHYKRSKFLAEEAVRAVASEGAPVVIVNPSTPVGPWDVKPTPTGRMIRDAVQGKIPAFVDTGLNIAHVEDVAEGHLLAAAQGQPGRRYVLGGENLSLREILAVIAACAGRKPPKIRLPRGPLYPVALAAEGWARATRGAEPLLTVDGLRMAGKRMWFSSDRAKAELGYAPRPAAEALADAVAWFQGDSEG